MGFHVNNELKIISILTMTKRINKHGVSVGKKNGLKASGSKNKKELKLW